MRRLWFGLLLACTTLAYAAPPDKVPDACRQQIARCCADVMPD